MADINRVILIGRLTRDAELKYTNTGSAICKFSIAVNRRRKSGDGWVDEVSFFDIAAWGKMGESLNQYLVKGKQIAVEGELRQDRWEQDGQPRSKVEIFAMNIQLLGGARDGSGSAGGGGAQRAATSRQGGNYGDEQGSSEFEDDIPF